MGRHILVLFVSTVFYARTRDAGILHALMGGKCNGTILLRVSPWWQQAQALLFLCVVNFVDVVHV